MINKIFTRMNFKRKHRLRLINKKYNFILKVFLILYYIVILKIIIYLLQSILINRRIYFKIFHF